MLATSALLLVLTEMHLLKALKKNHKYIPLTMLTIQQLLNNTTFTQHAIKYP